MGSRCLFVMRVKGSSLLPVPPAKITPFIASSSNRHRTSGCRRRYLAANHIGQVVILVSRGVDFGGRITASESIHDLGTALVPDGAWLTYADGSPVGIAA